MSAAAALGQGVLISRALGVEQYGVFGVVLTFVAVLSGLTSFRLHEFVVKYVSDALALRRKDQAGAVIRAAMLAEVAAALVAFAIIWLLAPLGAGWLVRTPDADVLIRCYAIVVLVGGVSETSTGVLQVFGRFRAQSLATAAAQTVSLALTAAAFAHGAGLYEIFLIMVVSRSLASGALLCAAASETSNQLGRGWMQMPFSAMSGRWRPAARFVLSTNASSTLSLVTRDADLLWLGLFRGPVEAGYYKLALSLAGALLMPLAPLVQTVYPEIARKAARQQWRSLRELLRRTSVTAALYVLPAGAVVVLLGGPLISLLYGREFVPAWPALVVLFSGMAYSHVLFWSRPGLLAIDRADFAMKVNLALALAKVAGVVIVVPLWGYVGAASLLAGMYIAGVSVSAWKVAAESGRADGAELDLVFTGRGLRLPA